MALTIVRPVSSADINRLHSSVDVMVALGGLQKHVVIFACAPSVSQQVAELVAKLRPICPQVFMEILPREPEPHGKFGAFNAIFRDSVEMLYKRDNKNPWLWMEADMDPIQGGWVDRLELQYHKAGQPFMGVRRKASEVMRGPKGEALDERDPRAQGDYMVAVGLYPPNFKDYSTMYKYPDPTGAMPTDVQIRHEINRHLQHTDLIAHHWGTANYHRNGSDIVCEDKAKVGHVYGGVVSPMAVIVHGCKDSSLADLILSSPAVNVEHMPPVNPAFQGANPDVTALQRENEELRRDIANMQEQWRIKENGYADEIERLKEQLAGDSLSTGKPVYDSAKDGHAESAVEKPLPSLDKIKDALRDAKKSIQLGVLAADFGVNKKLLRDLLETDPQIQIAKGGLAWVSLAA